MGQAASSLRKPVVRATSAASNTAAAATASAKAPRSSQPPPGTSTTAAASVDDAAANQQLLQNLTKLGQVTVDSPAILQRTHEQMTHLVRMQELSESASTTDGKSIDANSLWQLLEEHKHTRTIEDANKLAKRYKIDPELVQRLSKIVNTPTLGREIVLPTKDGESRTFKEALWVDPQYQSSS
ncbi:hypothetical protein FRC17_008040 [Serendipita sp. 399]|nr:hypothetical protein FRC17_008040 [Serendipita sp. 399]